MQEDIHNYSLLSFKTRHAKNGELVCPNAMLVNSMHSNGDVEESLHSKLCKNV